MFSLRNVTCHSWASDTLPSGRLKSRSHTANSQAGLAEPSGRNNHPFFHFLETWMVTKSDTWAEKSDEFPQIGNIPWMRRDITGS